jgi:hypothetical protein
MSNLNDYQKKLENLTVPALKQIIKTYMQHVKITVSKKKKSELITHLMEHTKLENNKIVLKNISFNMPKKKEPKKQEPIKKEEPKKQEPIKKEEPKKDLIEDNYETLKNEWFKSMLWIDDFIKVKNIDSYFVNKTKNEITNDVLKSLQNIIRNNQIKEDENRTKFYLKYNPKNIPKKDKKIIFDKHQHYLKTISKLKRKIYERQNMALIEIEQPIKEPIKKEEPENVDSNDIFKKYKIGEVIIDSKKGAQLILDKGIDTKGRYYLLVTTIFSVSYFDDDSKEMYGSKTYIKAGMYDYYHIYSDRKNEIRKIKSKEDIFNYINTSNRQSYFLKGNFRPNMIKSAEYAGEYKITKDIEQNIKIINMDDNFDFIINKFKKQEPKKDIIDSNDIFKKYKVGEVIKYNNKPQLIIKKGKNKKGKYYLLTTEINYISYRDKDPGSDYVYANKTFITNRENDQKLITEEKYINKIKSNESISSLIDADDRKYYYINTPFNAKWWTDQGYGGEYTISKDINENEKIITMAWEGKVPYPRL